MIKDKQKYKCKQQREHEHRSAFMSNTGSSDITPSGQLTYGGAGLPTRDFVPVKAKGQYQRAVGCNVDQAGNAAGIPIDGAESRPREFDARPL